LVSFQSEAKEGQAIGQMIDRFLSYTYFLVFFLLQQNKRLQPSFWGFHFDPNPTTHIFLYIRNKFDPFFFSQW